MRIALALSLLLPCVSAASAQAVPEPPAAPEPTGPEIALPDVELEVPEFLRPAPGGMTADDAARIAVDTAPQARAARVDERLAGNRVDQALASFIPRVDFAGSYTRLSAITLPPLFDLEELDPAIAALFEGFDTSFPVFLDLFAVTASVSIPVSDYFLVNLPAYDGALGFQESARAQREVQEELVAFRAREAYYNYIRARAGLWVGQEAVESLDATLQDVASLVRAGVSTRADYAQLRGATAQARAAVTRAEGGVRLAARNLRQLLHEEGDGSIAIGEDLFAVALLPPPDEGELVDAALDDRAEVRAIRGALRAREGLIRSRIGGTLPRIVVTGQLETSSPNQRFIPQTTDINTTWAIVAALSWSPNDLGMGVLGIQEAEAQRDRLEEDLAALEDGIRLEGSQAVSAYATARDSIAALREQLVAAQVALDDRRALLNAGRATSTELVQSQLDFTRAQLALINAYVDLHLARAQIARVRGRALPEASE
jgi:outer membrane protein